MFPTALSRMEHEGSGFGSVRAAGRARDSGEALDEAQRRARQPALGARMVDLAAEKALHDPPHAWNPRDREGSPREPVEGDLRAPRRRGHAS